LWVSASLCLHILSHFGIKEVVSRVQDTKTRRQAQQAAGNIGPVPTEIEFTYLPPAPATPDTAPATSTTTAANDLEPLPRPPVQQPLAHAPVTPPVHTQPVQRSEQVQQPRPTPPPTTPQASPTVAAPRVRPMERMQQVDQE